MGLFSNLFNSEGNVEAALEAQTVQFLISMTGMSPAEAKSNVRVLLEEAKADSRREGTDKVPLNYGDILLEKEHSDIKVKQMLDKKRREGVKDSDIRWWWNMSDLERRMMWSVDNLTKTITAEHKISEGLTTDEAVAWVGKRFPVYGDPSDTSHAHGDDRPLPDELKDRVNIWNMRQLSNTPQEAKRMINARLKQYSSYNAMVRAEIKSGRV